MVLPLLSKIRNRWPVERWAGLTIVVGCSGGADSTALLLAACQLRPADSTLIVAHYNHRLRGTESDEDEGFVAGLANSLDCLFISNSLLKVDALAPADSRPTESSPRDEASLRDIRYCFLRNVAETHGARYVAVGHTADDSVETSLHNLVRGTGLSGLTGISAHRNLNEDLVLIRPLIDVWRSEVIDFLEQNRQAFRQDSSNASPEYTRNRIRHRLLPVLEDEFGSDTKASIHRSSTILAELQQWLHWHSQQWLEQFVLHRTPSRVDLIVTTTLDREWPVVQNALVILWQEQSWPLMAMTHRHWSQVRALFQLPLTKYATLELPSRIRVSRNGERLVIEIRRQD